MRLALAIPVALAMLTLAACRAAPEPEGPRIDTADDLFAALATAGVDVGQTATVAARPGLPSGRVVLVGTERVEVYETESESAQRAMLQTWLRQQGADAPANVWGGGRVIVVYDGVDGATTALLSGFLGDSVSRPAPAVDEPYPPAVVSAIGWWAKQMGAAPGAVIVETFEAADWPNACLGLAELGEMCSEVVTPGWRITLRIGSEISVLRADDLGAVLRREP